MSTYHIRHIVPEFGGAGPAYIDLSPEEASTNSSWKKHIMHKITEENACMTPSEDCHANRRRVQAQLEAYQPGSALI
jgi:hypothetical protein